MDGGGAITIGVVDDVSSNRRVKGRDYVSLTVGGGAPQQQRGDMSARTVEGVHVWYEWCVYVVCVCGVCSVNGVDVWCGVCLCGHGMM